MNFATLCSTVKTAIISNKAAMHEADKKAATVMMLLLLCFLAFVPDIAMATAEPWEAGATAILNILRGPLAISLATIAVVACGIAAISGKLSWDWAIKIIVGIVLIFGAPAIVTFVTTLVRS